MPRNHPPQPDALRTRCLCCGKPAGNGTYIGRPVCFDCYESGKLLDCLAAEMYRNMVTPPAADETDWQPPQEAHDGQ